MKENRLDIRSMTKEELGEQLQSMGLPSFRTAQVYRWLQRDGMFSFGEMTNLPMLLREELEKKFCIFPAKIEKRLESKQDDTVKYLYRLWDGECVEAVLMKHHYGHTLCLSSQVGCRMGCTFCASTLTGLARSLTASEMLGQIHATQRDRNVRVSRLVLMGMGEPLDNFDQVIRFMQLVSHEEGLNIGMRHITLSTCGLVDGIYKLMEYALPITLSVSLHAPNDDIRRGMMPVARRWKMEKLLQACRVYAQKTSRRVSFEYTMIAGVNDSDQNADELADRLRGMLCHVNLIPVNEIRENSYRRSGRERILSFQRRLEQRGIPSTLRASMGGDIEASCGQLRQRAAQAEEGRRGREEDDL